MTGAPLSPAVGLYLIISALVIWGLLVLVDRSKQESEQ